MRSITFDKPIKNWKIRTFEDPIDTRLWWSVAYYQREYSDAKILLGDVTPSSTGRWTFELTGAQSFHVKRRGYPSAEAAMHACDLFYAKLTT